MDEFIKWLSANPIMEAALPISFIGLPLVVALIYIIAFVQGREVSFWPPKIGQKQKELVPEQKARITRSTNGFETGSLGFKSHFFEINPKDNGLIVMNNHPESPGRMSHGDVDTLVEVVKIIHELDGKIVVAPFDKIIEPPGKVTEFCIGGPDSNQRTQIHLDNFLMGVRINAYSPDSTDSIAIQTRDEKFRYVKDETTYAVLAKFRPDSGSHPVFLICGQTDIANKGAMHYLSATYGGFLKDNFLNDPFCLIVRITSPMSYGYKSVELFKDITDTAFKPWPGMESRPVPIEKNII